MRFLERIFLITDAIFPAKTPRWEREKIYRDIASLTFDIRTMTLVAPKASYLRAPDLVPNRSILLDTGDNFALPEEEIGALLLDIPPYDAIVALDVASKDETLARVPLIVAPIAFQKRFHNRPFYSALTVMLSARGYSLFNLYNVAWKRGQIQTAYALFISQELRNAFVKRIQV